MVLYAYFIPMTDELINGLDYVDLLLNPERYTGYKGPSPRRIWRAIYEGNCFKWVFAQLCIFSWVELFADLWSQNLQNEPSIKMKFRNLCILEKRWDFLILDLFFISQKSSFWTINYANFVFRVQRKFYLLQGIDY